MQHKLECYEPKISLCPPVYFFKPFYELEKVQKHAPLAKFTPTHNFEKKTYFKKESHSDESQEVSEEDMNNLDNSEMNRGEWTKEEHESFVKGNLLHGKNWALIAKQFVKSRTRQQVRNHAVKFAIRCQRIEKQQKMLKQGKRGGPYPVMAFTY